MKSNSEATRLRFYISNTDKFRHTLLSETLVFAAKRYGLAGATVTKGCMGYGSGSVIHSAKFWEITEKLPVIVEMVDEPTKIEQFVNIILPWFDKIPTGCLITRENVGIAFVKKGKKTFF
ncbi:DUF190 domain-containing protein [Lentimicrobium sp.]|jgi:PII-like signaling protein|uniref:DUF190 domain-containing protein n=1 Tax=Lentimicrobium sp. TaxID=2034841 RepID=UPI002CB08F8D|nr:DUF190 domain-containing protein [Lentimicrobium sp.]HPJ63357.1 DUF190 domain-containing protein [Lentimicrobium sp.]